MVKVWDSENSSDEKCGNCGSIYSVTLQRFPTKEKDQFNCTVCGHLMKSWNSTTSRDYELKS
jgi:DNA-directed RNA polymerase subunit RPC12/RpoP